MKLKMLREHYQSNDNQTWTPKISFSSLDDIDKAGLEEHLWQRYRCTLCGNLHVAKIGKWKQNVN